MSAPAASGGFAPLPNGMPTSTHLRSER